MKLSDCSSSFSRPLRLRGPSGGIGSVADSKPRKLSGRLWSRGGQLDGKPPRPSINGVSDWKQSFRLFRPPAATDPYGKLSIRVFTRYSARSEPGIGRCRASTPAHGVIGSQANPCADRRGCPPQPNGTDSGGISLLVPARTTVLLITDVDRTHSRQAFTQPGEPAYSSSSPSPSRRGTVCGSQVMAR